jgi:nucleoside-diphosphate-sugar epimerase
MSSKTWRDARVLVTGARGFIARRLCRQLVGDGAIVYGVSSRHHADSANSIRWLQADLSDSRAVRALVTRVAPDLVFHLAG